MGGIKRLGSCTDLRPTRYWLETKASNIFLLHPELLYQLRWGGPGPAAGAFCIFNMKIKAEGKKKQNNRNCYQSVRIISSLQKVY